MHKLKNFEDLVFSDDFMFGKIMGDSQLCREVLECLLQRSVGELHDVQVQREYKYTSDGKPIRLDVYSQNQTGELYDAEMENLNHKTVESHQLPKRTRFYQSSIDMDFLDKCDSYKKLPESTVIFICTFDPFGKGMYRYSFRERCDETADLLLNDGTTKIFYNCTYEGSDLPEGLRQLYDYINHGKVKGNLTKKIDDAVIKGKKNEIWRSQYMKERVIIQDAKEEGREETLIQSIRNIMKNLKLTAEQAMDSLGLSPEEKKKYISML